MIALGFARVVAPPRERRERGRAALRAWLAERIGGAVSLAYDDRGAPTLPGTGLFVSASHSGDVLLFALADRPIGVDLEQVRNVAPAFARWLGFDAEKDSRAVLARWTGIEAYWKARGEGVGTRGLGEIARTPLTPEGWDVRQLALEGAGLPDFVASLAVRSGGREDQVEVGSQIRERDLAARGELRCQ